MSVLTTEFFLFLQKRRQYDIFEISEKLNRNKNVLIKTYIVIISLFSVKFVSIKYRTHDDLMKIISVLC